MLPHLDSPRHPCQTRSFLLILAGLFFLQGSGLAVPPDLTNGGAPTTSITLNLGPTGFQGWLYHEKTNTSQSRQILVTTVDPGSPSDGILMVDDVILGANGTGAEPVNFSSDARRSLAQAIAGAEANSPAALKVLRWRAGITTTETIILQTLGTYAATAPYHCLKSALILENGLAHRAANEGSGNFGLGALALLAGNDRSNPANAARQTLARAEAQALIAAPEKIAFWMSGQVDTRSKVTWSIGHQLTMLAEYYLQTTDPLVLPTIEAMAVQVANGQSHLGTMGHQLTNPASDGSLNGAYNVGYGTVNSAGIPCFLGLLLARECGLTNPEIEPAIERASRFFASYTGYGAHPYGEHEPYRSAHESNGKSGLAALSFMLQDNRVEEGKFFARMATAASSERENGHTGPYFNQLWAPLGAAAGGEEAVATHFSRISWMLDLNRRWDGGFYWNRLDGSGSGPHWNNFEMSTIALLTYALPLRQLYITGKGHDPSRYLTSGEVAEATFADEYDAAARSTNDLVVDLGSWSPKVQRLAATELGNRTAEHATLIPQLIDLANDTNAGELRVGACFALGEIGDGSAAPTLAALLTDTEEEVRYASAEALRWLPQADRLTHISTILTAADLTKKPFFPIDEEDPMQFAHHRLAMLLFYSGNAYGPKGVIWGNRINGIDRNLLYPAIKAVAGNPNGQARSTLAETYRNLSQLDVDAVADAIVNSVRVRAPADKMFSAGVRLGGLDILETYHISEGVPLSKAIAEDPELKNNEQTHALGILELYAGSSTLVEPNPEIIDFCEFLAFTDPTLGANAQLVLNAIAADTNPVAPTPFKSIQSVTAGAPVLTLPSTWTTLHVAATDHAQGDSVYTWRKINGAGTVTFSPNGTGTASDTTIYFDGTPGHYLFEVTMSDSRGLTEVHDTIAMTLYDTGGGLPANDPPTAIPQALTIPQATTTPITLTGSDPEGLDLGYTVTSQPANGTLKGMAPYLTYLSDFTYTGPDSFTFEVIDSEGQTASATISLTVNPASGFETAVYEPFNYPAGGLHGRSGASEVGLDGTWVAGSETLLTAGSLNYGSLITGGGKVSGLSGSSNRFGGARTLSAGTLAATGLLNHGATLWFSAVVGYDPGVNLTNARLTLALANNQFNSGNYNYWIDNDGAQLGSGLGLQLGRIGGINGRVIAAQYRDLASGDGTGGIIEGSWEGNGATYGGGEAGLIVGRITWGADSSQTDLVELFQPNTDMALPPTPISTLSTIVDQATFDTITFARGDSVTLDEVRFGGTYHSVLLGTAPMMADNKPPAPDPAGFDKVPTAASGTSITMTAMTAYDPAGVEYYFTCTAGGGHDSGWQRSTTYTDAGLTPGMTYTYNVTARDLSPAQNATTPSIAESVLLPGQLTIPGVVGMARPSAEAIITTYSFAVGTVTPQPHPSVPAGEVINQNPTEGTSAAVGATVDLAISLGNVPSTPTILGATATSGSGVTLTWTDNSIDETGFKIQRSSSSGTGFATIDTTPVNVTSYHNQGLNTGTTYFYRVIATNSTGDSAASGETSATTWTAGESWRNQYFNQLENSGNAADDFDFDGDGVANLLERAFGTLPNDANSMKLPTTSLVNEADSQYLAITYRRRKGGTGTSGVNYTVDDLFYCVEYDNDISNPWDSGSVTQLGIAIDNGDGTESVTIRLNAEVGTNPRQFIRLGVGQMP